MQIMAPTFAIAVTELTLTSVKRMTEATLLSLIVR